MVESFDLSSWRVLSWTDIVYVANEVFIWVCRVKPLNEYVFLWLFRVRPHKRFIHWTVSCQAPPRASWNPKVTQCKCRRQHFVSKQKTQGIISCVTLGTCVHYVWIFCWRQESQQRCLFVCLFVKRFCYLALLNHVLRCQESDAAPRLKKFWQDKL